MDRFYFSEVRSGGFTDVDWQPMISAWQMSRETSWKMSSRGRAKSPQTALVISQEFVPRYQDQHQHQHQHQPGISLRRLVLFIEHSWCCVTLKSWVELVLTNLARCPTFDVCDAMSGIENRTLTIVALRMFTPFRTLGSVILSLPNHMQFEPFSS